MTDQQTEDRLSLEEIEGEFWGAAPEGASRLVSTVHELRRRPVGELTAEDLRVLIGQRVGLAVLMPRVLAILERDPLVEGDFYPGDLLVAVLGVPGHYWASHPDDLARARVIAAGVEPAEADDAVRRDLAAFRSGG
jgi:hypothetical protein